MVAVEMPMESVTASAAQNVPQQEIYAALEHILASRIFNRAHRMCRLLRYLIEKDLSGSRRDMSEYAIGLEVFDRNPSTYYPGEDAVVRVQVGRLRERLKSYYAGLTHYPEWIFSIPVGNYVPLIESRSDGRSDGKGHDRLDGNLESREVSDSPPASAAPIIGAFLSLLPLHYAAEDFGGRVFTKGVDAALSHQFLSAFGMGLISFQALHEAVSAGAGKVAGYFVEGNVLANTQAVEVNIRIIDVASHAIMHSQQFVHAAAASVPLQDQMAQRICDALRQLLRLDHDGAVAMPPTGR
jgi:TolB-like protein